VSHAALTAVLPLRVGAQRKTSDLDRFERLLLPSFRRFWQGPDQLEFLLLVPPADVECVRARVALGGWFPMRVLSEDAVCPSLSGRLGWHKQQILKLAAARIVPTPWYLTLDADVMLRRTVSVDELVRDGRAIFHPKRAARHWEWWTASRMILRSDFPLGPNMEMMDVTPEILHRDTVLELLAETGRRNDVPEVERFLFEKKDAGWTEYSLYWLFVLERQLQDRLYRKAGPLYEMAWRPEHLSWPHRRSDDDPSCRPPFFVLQSTLEIPIEEAERLMSADPSDAAATPPHRPGSLLRRLFRPPSRGTP
jgi:Family of unknown function (DUF6492)